MSWMPGVLAAPSFGNGLPVCDVSLLASDGAVVAGVSVGVWVVSGRVWGSAGLSVERVSSAKPPKAMTATLMPAAISNAGLKRLVGVR